MAIQSVPVDTGIEKQWSVSQQNKALKKPQNKQVTTNNNNDDRLTAFDPGQPG